MRLLWQESLVAHSQSALAAQAQALARGQRLTWHSRPIDLLLPARALVHEAQARLLELPFVANAGQREEILTQAQTALQTALDRRPDWGEAQTILAFVQSQRGPGAAAPLRTALIASYDNAPYLRGGSDWRISQGLAIWSSLPPRTRARIVDEAAWVLRFRPDRRDFIFNSMRASPAYMPFMLRWRQVRLLDADLRPN